LNVLVFEYITGGGLANSALPPSLAREGELMWRALVRDLAEIAGVEMRVLRDARLPVPAWTDQRVTLFPASTAGFAAVWERACNHADAVWPIAPETDGILADLCRDISARGKILLNSPAEAVRLTASKRLTSQALRGAGVAAVPTFRLIETPPDGPWPRVVKPDDGVGCENTRLLRHSREWDDWYPRREAAEWVVQPYLSGEAMSLSALFCHGEGRLLTINRQHVVRENSGFVLRGCRVGVEPDRQGIYQDLIGQIARAIPGLWGYAGVDFIRGESGPVVLEINPRLTTSWAGLYQALGVNPAALVLDLARDRPLTELAIPIEPRPVEVEK
jgi:predicted ATP-grasp superfamily ATP-dependent carboligase